MPGRTQQQGCVKHGRCSAAARMMFVAPHHVRQSVRAAAARLAEGEEARVLRAEQGWAPRARARCLPGGFLLARTDI
jgi:hypothetical protein